MLDLALKKNEKLEFELRVAQKRFASVEDALKEVEFLRVTNTELESEIRLYKTRIQSVESRAADFPESESFAELRRAKIDKERENESLKNELKIFRQQYEVNLRYLPYFSEAVIHKCLTLVSLVKKNN